MPSLSSPLSPPAEHGQISLSASPSCMLAQAITNRDSLSRCDKSVFGRALSAWRDHSRNELMALTGQYAQKLGIQRPCRRHNPLLIATGHQCQFFHCGILAKYMIINRLAQQSDGWAVNLVLDHDPQETLALQMPIQGSQGWHLRSLIVDRFPQGVPIERRLLRQENIRHLIEVLRQANHAKVLAGPTALLARAMEQIHPYVANLTDWWLLLLHRLMSPLGIHWLDLPVSVLCNSTAFAGFAADLLRRPSEVRQHYNNALEQFRRLHLIKDASRPMPDLTSDGDVQETPFWLAGSDGRQKRLFVRHNHSGITLADETQMLFKLPSSCFADVATAGGVLRATLEEKDLRLQPRALTLTLFARLFLADYFVHGTGGASYDQITDQLLTTLYGTAPPAYGWVTATMHLDLGVADDPEYLEGQLRRLEQSQRDLQYNPQKFFHPNKRSGHDHPAHPLTPETHGLLEQRQEAISVAQDLKIRSADSQQRRQAFLKIRQLNHCLAQKMPEIADEVSQHRRQTRHKFEQATLAQRRDYFFGLFPRETLEKLSAMITMS